MTIIDTNNVDWQPDEGTLRTGSIVLPGPPNSKGFEKILPAIEFTVGGGRKKVQLRIANIVAITEEVK